MKRKFTKLMAALALLVFMTPSMVGWGQTRDNITETMTASDLTATGTAYSDFSNVALTNGSNARYAGQSAKDSSGNIQLRSKNSNSGIVSTTSGGKIKSVKITVGSGIGTISVYGNNTAYTSATELYATGSNSNQGTLIQEITSTTTITVSTDYAYVGIRSKSGAVYISSIEFTWEPVGGGGTPSLSVNPSSILFGEVNISSTNEESFTITYSNLTTPQTLTVAGFDGVSVSPTSISVSQASGSATVTVSYNPTAVGSISGDITVSSTTDNKSATVAVSGSAYDPSNVPTYTLYSGDLVEGDYLIVYNGNAMNTTVTSSNRLQFEKVFATNDVITTNNAAIVWHIAPSGNYWTIFNDDANAYAASTGTKNQAQMLNDGTDGKALWTASGTETYEFVNKYNSTYGINSNLRNNGTYGFACYATSTGGALSLYKKMALDINAYSGTKDNYFLIATPVTVDPGNVTDMTEGDFDFDLYYFAQDQEGAEWRNYEANPFNLVPGKGYLYANSTDVTLAFSGELYSGNGVIDLDYTDGNNFAGWNLIGNPYATNATIPNNQSYYTLNTDRDELIAGESTTIGAMEGIFVKATAAGQSVTFTPTRGNKGEANLNSRVVLNLNGDHGVIDRAIIRFDQGQQLPKFMLNANSTKLYIPQGTDDYAIVRSNGQGEMPVNFKASQNGTYTLSVNAENLEMDYLHLIDNMTGANVDLLATPSYTFEAKTTDYASRFRLVFNANEENGASTSSETFAFFNGSEWMISNTGNATLQVIDVLGRVLSSETISGTVTVSLKETSGVYMLRLVNGNDVKVQKVVVR